jgi:hypothetical protein
MVILLYSFLEAGINQLTETSTMLKLPLMLINFIGLFFLHFFSVSEITIQNMAPSTLTPGEKVLVEVSIDKASIQGFAKMEIVFPEGFIATPAETSGASFTFSEKKVRFVWMTLPTEQTFKVSYYLECDPNFSGKYEVKGTFSYINDNERVDFKVSAVQVMVSKTDAVAATNTDTNQPDNTTTEINNTTTTENTETTNATDNTSVASTSTEMSVTRTITQISPTEFKVDVLILNSNIQGFAKIFETSDVNTKIEKIQDANATVTVDKNTVKFVWFEMPVSPAIAIAYKVKTLSATTTVPTINGKLSFVESNNPKEMAIIQGAAVGSDVIASNPVSTNSGDTKSDVSTTTENNTNTNTAVNSNTTKTDNSTKVENTASNASTNTEVKPSKEERTKPSKGSETAVTSVPSPETGITYKVQILAAHRVVNKSYFQSKHGYDGAFNIENHDGWVKYTTGRFDEYKSARDERERLKGDYNTLPGPFVTAYNNGERITVQEALLITKQQWYK